MKHIRNFFAGIIIGIANIIPGVSGGTMAVVLGVYDRLIGSISLSIEKLKKNWLFLLTIFGGAGVGILLFAKLLTFLFQNYNVPTQFFFIGLIVGSLPFVWKKTVLHSSFKTYNVIPFAVTLGIMILMSIAKAGENTVQTELTFPLFFLLILCAIIAAIAMIIPGISGSFMLKAIGQYETVLAAIDRLDILMLIPVGIGILIGIIGGAKLIGFLLKKFHQTVYSAILGLVVGSVFVIYPQEFAFNAQGFIAIGTLIFGIAITVLMDKLKKE